MGKIGKIESEELSYLDAIRIVENALEALKSFFKAEHVIYINMFDKNSMYRSIFKWNDNEPQAVTRKKVENEKEFDYCDDGLYIITYEQKQYKVQFYNSEDAGGYYSNLKDYNPETYIFCEISELEFCGFEKNKVYFAFDSVSMKFLELFSVFEYSINKNSKECKKIYKLEKKFLNVNLRN